MTYELAITRVVLSAAILGILTSAALAQERTYSVIEYLANQQQLGSAEARVKGEAVCYSEVNCVISGDGRSANFASTMLLEADRIALLKSGNGAPQRQVIVTIQNGNAKKSNF